MGDMADFALDECMDEVYDEHTNTFVDGWSRGIYDAQGSGPCPLCESPTVKKVGRFGPFYGCVAYPHCRGHRSAYEWEVLEWRKKMSDYTPRPGSFTLFRNRFKEAGDKKPDYTGNGAGLDGEPLKIAGWIKEGKNGEKFMSVSISVPEQRDAAPAPPPPPAADEDCPF